MFKRIFFTYFIPNLLIAVLSIILGVIFIFVLLDIRASMMEKSFEVEYLENLSAEANQNKQTKAGPYLRMIESAIDRRVALVTGALYFPLLDRFDTPPFDAEYALTVANEFFSDLDHQVRHVKKLEGSVRQIMFSDRLGEVLSVYPEKEKIRTNYPSLSEEPLFLEARSSTKGAFQIRKDPESGKPLLYYYYPLKNSNEEVNGLFHFRMELDFIQNEIDELMKSESGVVLSVFTRDRQRIAHWSSEGQKDNGEVASSAIEKAFETRAGSQSQSGGIADYQVGKYDLAVFTSVSVDEVVKPAKTILVKYRSMSGFKFNYPFIYYGLIALALIVLSVILGLIAARMVTGPLLRMKRATAEVAAGDLSVKLEKPAIQELAVLADSFNKMVQQLNRAQLDLVEKNALISGYADQLHELNESLEQEVRKRSRELIVSNKELIRKMEEQDNLVYRFSHDLKGPVDSIKGLISIMNPEKLEESDRRYLGLIQESAERLLRVVFDLTELIRVDKSRFEPVPVDFALLLKDVMGLIGNLPGTEEVEFRTNLEEISGFSSDRQSLQSILQNLIENSIKYRNTEAEQSWVSCEVAEILDPQTGNPAIHISISDNGLGIPDRLQDKVFQMFYRGIKISKGSGLGLYLTKVSVERLGGTISLRSKEGKGTTVDILIPKYRTTH
jgi:signal transduction histidine kinase